MNRQEVRNQRLSGNSREGLPPGSRARGPGALQEKEIAPLAYEQLKARIRDFIDIMPI